MACRVRGLSSSAQAAESVEVEPNNTVAAATPISIQSVVNGRLNQGTDQDVFKFKATRGQRIVLDCWAYRIDSHADATLVLTGPKGEELARNRDTNRLDPLIDFTAAEDGEYFVTVYDFLYGGGPDYFYRLSVTTAPYIEFIMPPAGQAGTSGKFTLYGRNLPGGQVAPQCVVEGKPLESLAVEIALPGDDAARAAPSFVTSEPSGFGMDSVEYHLDSPQGTSNSLQLGVAYSPVIVEQEPNDTPDKAQMVTTPVEICGQFNPRRDRDWYIFPAKKGDVFWIEVYSERMGEPTDPFLLVEQVVKNDKGEESVKELRAMDDAAKRRRKWPFPTTQPRKILGIGWK